MRHGKILAIALMAAVGSASPALAAISYTTGGSSVQQDFNSLSSGSSSSWTNDSTLPGWSLFAQPAPGTPITTISGGTGSSNAGSFYSFGTNAERALGGVGSGGSYFGSPSTGSIAGWIAVSVTNNTGFAIDSFSVGYDGEQWRNGGNTSAQTMVLEYGFGATFGSVGSWIAPGGAFDFTSLVNTASAGALDGNLPANRAAGRGGSVNGLNWLVGSTLWIRWVELNDPSNDHGLAIDNFSFSANTVPTPGAFALLGAGGVLMLGRRRK